MNSGLLQWVPLHRVTAIMMITIASTAVTANEKSVPFTTELSP